MLKSLLATRRFILACVLCAFSQLAFAQNASIKIQFWNALGGQLAVILNKMIKQFNQTHPQYQIVNDFKGDYNSLLTSLVAAYRAGQPPAIAQVYEIGTSLMLLERPAIVPVQQLMQANGFNVTPKIFLPAIGAYYSSHGKLMSLPFNSSSPVLYYNKDEFKKAGLTDKDVPKTWPQMQAVGKRLLKAGIQCAYTTAWPAWIQLEEFSAWHNIPYATQDNGLSGFNVKALYDNKYVIRQVATLNKWQHSGIFQYGGRGDNPQALFTSGHCAMETQSSGSRGSLMSIVKFHMGVAEIPYWPDIKGAPQNTIIGGASLWVMQSKSKAVYKGVAEFFNFLLKPATQLEWQKATGYLPLTMAGYQYALKRNFYKKNPGSIVAVNELNNKSPTAYSRGIRLGNFPQIRDINDTALEAVFSGQSTAKQALSKAVKQANKYLKRYKEMADAGS